MNGYTFRQAIAGDIPFLTEVVIAAEKSNSDKLSFSTLFDIPEKEAGALITAMFEEDIDGCEFSVSSFIVAVFDDKPVAAFGGWIEEFDGNKASGILKSNLIGYTFGRERIEKLKARSAVIQDVVTSREPMALQLEYLYVSEKHRGKGLAIELIKKLEERAKGSFANLQKVQVQLFDNNLRAMTVYEKCGFTKKNIFRSDNPETLNYLPFNVKTLMEKNLNN